MPSERLHKDIAGEPKLYMAAYDRDLPPGTRYGPVVRDLYIVECCTNGRGSVIINDREITFSAGDCYIIPPGQKVIHTADPVTSREGVYCAIDGRIVSKIVSDVGITPENPFVSGECFEAMVEVVTRMIGLSNDTDMGADLRRIACIYELLGIISRPRSAKNKNVWVEKALGYMETNYHKSITVEDISDNVGLERSYFSTLFKSRMGISPHAYLSELRVQKAVLLLGDGTYSVADAAEAVGLDPRNFSRLFKQITGHRPNDFKGKE